jgi:predicted amidophosphoribosyltransferase
MLDRHKPRLCRGCDAPMARQSDRCWRCHVARSVATVEPPRQSLEESTRHVLSTRARRQADGVRRDRPVKTRASDPRVRT